MPKSNPVNETRSADAVERAKRQRRLNGEEAKQKSEGAETANAAERCTVGTRSRVKPASRKTKQQTCLDLLSRQEGATIEELQAATGWQQHSVRGFLAGAVKKKLGLTLVSEKPDAKPRRYRTLQRGLIAVAELFARRQSDGCAFATQRCRKAPRGSCRAQS